MAIRRLNYTGRKRLKQSDLRFVIQRRRNGEATFEADLSLQSYNLPPEAEVFVEAYRQTSWMRFRFGTVADLGPHDELKLDEFDSPEGVLFRARVTSRSERKGLLLAGADRIRPRRADEEEEEDNRIPLLPVKSDENMRDEVYRLDFTDRPILLVNARVGDWRSLAREPVFVSLVYPVVLREILSRILRVERYFDTDDDDDWRSHWLRFATMLPGASDPPGENDEDQFDVWIDESATAFCRQARMMNHFRKFWTGEANA